MRKKSLNINWGPVLKELGYSYKNSNHFDKKYKNYWLCIDYDLIGYVLMFRLLIVDSFKLTKCIKQIDIKDITSLTQIGFINMVRQIEREFKDIIDDATKE